MANKQVFKRDANNVPVIGVLNTSTGKAEMVHGEDGLTYPLVGIMNYVWDSDGLTPIKMTQQSFNVDDLEALLIGSYFKNVRYDYDSNGNCIYKGMHLTLEASQSDNSWYIIRYDYISGNCTQKRFRITSWTNRTTGW